LGQTECDPAKDGQWDAGSKEPPYSEHKENGIRLQKQKLIQAGNTISPEEFGHDPSHHVAGRACFYLGIAPKSIQHPNTPYAHQDY
jgi:hypothetical protein